MLVALSDIHLTDGTTALNVHATAFDLLDRKIGAAANAKQATEVHVVLLGDIFDLVRTDYWHRKRVPPDQRPWGGTLDPLTATNMASAPQQFGEVLDAILATPEGAAFVRMLKKRATAVTFVPGNHDRAFVNFPSLKDKLTHALPGVVFADEFRGDAYGVFGRHGHEWDDNCHGWAFYNKVLRPKGSPVLGRFDRKVREVMTIGEVITAELMSGLVFHATAAMGSQAPAPFLKGLKDVNNIRPMLDVFPWIDWFRNQYPELSAAKPALHAALRASLDGLLDSPLARLWDRLKWGFLVWGDVTDTMALLNQWIVGRSFDQLRRRVSAARKLIDRPGKDESLRGASEEEVWRAWSGTPPSPFEYVVYGHTHEAKHVTFEADLENRVRMYVNTGTTLPLIQRTSTRKGFDRAGQMTLAFFYNTNENQARRAGPGPTLDLWNGIRRKDYA